jgi:Amt family ammonium transporter
MRTGWWIAAVLLALTCTFSLAAGAGAQQKQAPPDDPPAKQTASPKDPVAVVAGGDKTISELTDSLEAARKALAETRKALTETRGAAAEARPAAEASPAGAGEVVQVAADAKAAPPDPKKPEEDRAAAEAAAKKTAEDVAAASEKGVEGQKRGDTAWMLTSSALVMLMLPGLALFYGGMVRRKNVLATMMHSMACLAVVGLYWVAVGYSLAFGQSRLEVAGGGVIGWSWDLFFLQGVNADALLPGTNITVYTHVMFQGMFAIITPALISGAVAERIRFWPFCLFVVLWVTFVYCPLAHMVWAFDWFFDTPLDKVKGAGGSAAGLLGQMGALDFAGGTVVHIAAGMAGLAAVLVLRKRHGYPGHVAHPNSMVLTLLGAGLLWFGWFGFNGGSAGASTSLAASAFAATQAAAAAAGLGWIAIEWLIRGKPTALGLASGIVAGLVAVTPASGYVYVWGGVAIGLAAAALCYLAVAVKNRLGYDDSLDAFGVHAVGGFVGAVLTGLFCSSMVNSAGADGFFAVRWQESRIKELEANDKKAIADAKAKAEGLKKAADEAEAKYNAVKDDSTRKDEAADLEKAMKEAQADAAAATAKADGLGKELDALSEKKAAREKDKKGALTQLGIQFKAAGLAVVFAFVLSLGLALLTHAVTGGGFTTDERSEAEGLDRTEHGEVGFDFGYATESVPVVTVEPRAASVPPGNGRFDLAVEGTTPTELLKAWSALCQPTDGPADPDFLAVYPHVTTVQGTRFRFRGGDPAELARRVETLFKKQLGKDVKAAKVG